MTKPEELTLKSKLAQLLEISVYVETQIQKIQKQLGEEDDVIKN